MPEHTSFLSYLLAMFPGLSHNAEALGKMVMSGQPVSEHHVEPFVMSVLIAVLVLVLAMLARGQLQQTEKAVIPEAKLTLRTFIEVFVGAFYGLARDIMGAKRARQFFPVIGTSALFIFFSNLMGLIPGMSPPTSSLNITLGCGLLVAILFNYYGLRENGFGYIKHLWGPNLGVLGIPINILIFCIEALTMVVIRPLTLGVRLMINMAVDHLIGSIFLGLIALFLPIPAIFLGILVVVVQTVVFCLLSCVYIGLATEHEEHHEGAHHH
ncbi:MAG: F0F1 ATP synthase subunit A [Polyangiaceae bacterium]|jgi:F-type H+-transporting ATPase subunit a|nr:F0F1 ATP synthase subunit A [Polyangiaceae bacterium]